MSTLGDYNIKYIEDDDSVDVVTDMNENFMAVSDELDNLSDKIGDCSLVGHTHNLSNLTGLLSIDKGGTGANNATQAKKNLGISKHCYVVAAANSDSAYKNFADYVVPDTNTAKLLNSYIEKLPIGSTVYFAPGNYNLETYIRLTKSINIIGSGYNTKFIGEFNTHNLYVSNIDGMKIADICFKKNNSDNIELSYPLVEMFNVNRILFNNVFFEYMLPDNVAIDKNKTTRFIDFTDKATNICFSSCIMTQNFTTKGYTYNSVNFTDSNINSSVFMAIMVNGKFKVAYDSSNQQNLVSQCGNWNFIKIVDGVEVE